MAERIVDRVTYVRKVLGAFSVWMVRKEAALDRLYRALAIQVSLGIAPCPEVDAYNREATYFYSWALQIATKAKSVGVELPPPRFPSLFAHDVRTAPNGDIVADYLCDSAGYVIPGGLRPLAPCGATPVSPGLNGTLGLSLFPSPTCLAAAWSCAVLTLLQGAVVAGTIYISLEMATKLVRAFTDAELAEIERQGIAETNEHDADRAEYVTNCVTSSKLPAPTLEAYRALRKYCEEEALRIMPVRRGPEPPSKMRWAFWIGATALVGAVATAIYFARRPAHGPKRHEIEAGTAA